jgi:hypothetical protein
MASNVLTLCIHDLLGGYPLQLIKQNTCLAMTDWWSCTMRNWNWTPRARLIGDFLTALAIVGAGWVLFVGTWFALGGN